MSAHALREVAVPNAVADAPPPEVIAGATTTAEVMMRLKAGIAQAKALGGRQGYTKASVPVLDILVTTSRDDAGRMGKAGQDAYFRQALEFLGKQFGGLANILCAVIHRDESTPHMQVLVMPLDRTTNRFSAAKMIGGPKGLSELQDQFHGQVGQRHGLQRGEKGSTAKHVPVKQMYAAMAAGEAVPKMVTVPKAPGMVDRLKPGYADKKKAHEAAVLANKKTYERLQKQAKNGRMLHPKMIERQAEKYREMTRMDALIKTGQIAIAAEKKEILDYARIAKNAEAETRLLAQSADKIWEKSGAQILDRWSKTMDPKMVARVASAMSVELVAGRPLLDQLRKQGRGTTLIECAHILDKSIESVGLHQHVYSGDAQRSMERPKG